MKFGTALGGGLVFKLDDYEIGQTRVINRAISVDEAIALTGGA